MHCIPSSPYKPLPKPRSRRRFLLLGAAAAASLLGRTLRGAGAGESVLFVGTQTTGGSKGIYAYTWNAQAGALKLLGLAAEASMATFLALSPDKRFLFAANETDSFAGQQSGGVSGFRVKPGGRLTPNNSQPSGGAGACHVGLDPTGRVLLCANYTGGSASSFPVGADGRIGPVASHFQYTGHGPNHERQDAPHVHRATASPGGGWALFNDLGLDCIHIYKLDARTAALEPHGQWTAPAGSGPRALRFHPNGRWAYCVTEMGSEVLLLGWDESTGVLTTRQRVSLVPAGFSGRSQASEVVLDRTGRFLYAADRYYDGLYRFAVDGKTGELSGMKQTPMEGKTPRHIALDPTERWLLAANQDSDTIEIWARNPGTGELGERSRSVKLEKPQCLVFV